jgi:hypothetical protein
LVAWKEVLMVWLMDTQSVYLMVEKMALLKDIQMVERKVKLQVGKTD